MDFKEFRGKALIDGDIIIYRAAYAAEGQEDMFACHAAKRILLTIMDGIPKASSVKLFISTRDKIYRHDIAKHVPYKGHRKDRPTHYEVVRKYLKRIWGARVVPYVEADDAIGWETADDTLVISIDKDLWMLPGYHYNFITEETKFSADPGTLVLNREKGKPAKIMGTGFKWFCAQMLLGDVADNIKGVYRVGPVKTFNYLNRITDSKRLWRAIRLIYKKHGLSKERLHENAQLLWIQRQPGQTKPAIDGVPLWREKNYDTRARPTDRNLS